MNTDDELPAVRWAGKLAARDRHRYGPVVAAANRKDDHHEQCVELLQGSRARSFACPANH
jgi:hypothetical protein